MSRVSIQMCCYNGEKYLHAAIDSILAQSYTDWELVFWDNCSTDKSAAIVQSYNDPRIKYHLAPDHTDLGGGRARSWPFLTGEYIAFLDVDDTWEKDKLALQTALFEDKDVSIVAGDVMWMNNNHQQLLYDGVYPPEGHVTGVLLRHYFLSLPSVMVRRQSIENAGGGFDAGFSHNADFDLFLRASTVGKLAIVKQHIANWRVDMNSQSWSNRKFEHEHIKWAMQYKKTKWMSNHQFSFLYFQFLVIAKKIYFALVNTHYKKTPATGLLRFLDDLGWAGFYLLRWTPIKPWVRQHFQRRISKWV
jgi:glycosyltransferase involved in cell wall biosynthesis